MPPPRPNPLICPLKKKRNNYPDRPPKKNSLSTKLPSFLVAQAPASSYFTATQLKNNVQPQFWVNPSVLKQHHSSIPYLRSLCLPVSTTATTSSMVSDVSAMLVERTTFRTPASISMTVPLERSSDTSKDRRDPGGGLTLL